MKKNRKLCFAILLATGICFALSSCIKKEKAENKNSLTIKDGILMIGTEYGYPPFEYLDSDGKTLIGFDVDLWNELCRRMDLVPQYFDTQWAGIFSGLESLRYDCIISAVTITKERKEKFLITEPYVQNSECFIVQKKNPVLIDSPDKLKNLKVAYQAETVSDVYVSELLLDGNQFKTFEYDKLMDAFDDLKFGRVDVVVAESVAARNLVNENPEVFRIDFIGEPDAFFGILVNKSNSALFEKIQSILNQMYDDGFMKKIEDKWLK